MRRTPTETKGKAGMLPALYNALWYPVLPLALILSGAGRSRENFRQRLGWFLPDAAGGKPRLWMHAASVGEVEALRPIVAGLENDFPGLAAVVTTMTASGREAAARRIPGTPNCLLAPLDCRLSVRSFLRAVRPDLVVIAETELWPNYFIESRRAGAKVAVVNGRISRRSLGRYRLAGSLFSQAVTSLDLILAQTEDDARRYQALGASSDRIVVTGNTKLAFDSSASPPTLRPALRRFCEGRRILIAGSTAGGEEREVLRAFVKLRTSFPCLALVVAPRHLGRSNEVQRLMRAAGLTPILASTIDDDRAAGGADAMILDTMGELRTFYHRATIAFVGGTLTRRRGGQSLAEPALAHVPVLFGPYYRNQREVGEALLENGAGAVVADGAQLAEACARWLGDEAARLAAAARARQCVLALGGGAEVALQHLRALITVD